MSSTTARAATKTRKPGGMRWPSKARTPRAKATSVAVGTDQPGAVGPRLSARYMAAGANTPPIAAMMGSKAARRSARIPTVISRRISRPTSRKKKASRPWESQSPTVSERALVPDNNAQLGGARFEDWLNQSTKQAPNSALQRA